VALIAYILFFLAGLGFGYAALGRWKWIPLAFPLALALSALINDGLELALLLRLVIALALTAGGVLLGRRIDAGRPSPEHPGYA
jgi:hypothetical protein